MNHIRSMFYGAAAIAVLVGSITIAEPNRPVPIAVPAALKSVVESAAVTQVAMRDVDFYVTPNAALRIRELRGEMRALGTNGIVFDDKKSFAIRLEGAEVGLTSADLTSLMNSVVFAYPGAPLKRLKVHMDGNHLIQSGLMHKVVDIPFEITADVSATPAGLIRLHPLKTRILGIDGNGLMKAFNLTLEKILDLSKAKGVTVKGNDLYLDPTHVLPPPVMEGTLTGVRVEGDQLVETFGSPSAAVSLAQPDSSAPAYMYFRGGTVRFGKLLMLDADMQVVALKPSGRFGFDLDRYHQQLVAGYSRTFPNDGLEVFMASVETIGKKAQ
jgi:hypothetical protein